MADRRKSSPAPLHEGGQSGSSPPPEWLGESPATGPDQPSEGSEIGGGGYPPPRNSQWSNREGDEVLPRGAAEEKTGQTAESIGRSSQQNGQPTRSSRPNFQLESF